MTETASTRGCAAMRARSAPFAPAFTVSSVQASAGSTPGLPTPRGEGRANAPPPMLHARFARRSPWTCPAPVQPSAFTDL